MVLSYIDSHDGTATTHDVTLDTQLDNDQVRYQFEKLRDLDYVDLRKEEEQNFKVTRAVLTEAGEERVSNEYEETNERLTDTVEVLADLLKDLNDREVIDIDDYR